MDGGGGGGGGGGVCHSSLCESKLFGGPGEIDSFCGPHPRTMVAL